MAPQLTPITGALRDTAGTLITSGTLIITPQSIIINDTDLHSTKPVNIAIPGSGSIYMTLAPGTYTVEFDPTPADTITPIALKPGYFTDTWVIPRSFAPVELRTL